MSVRVRTVVQGCVACNTRVARKRPGVHVSGRERIPCSVVVIDCVCLDSASDVWSLTMSDRDTGYMHAALLPCRTSEAVMRTFLLEWLAVFGLAQDYVISDLGGEFTGSEFVGMCDGLGLEKRTSHAYEPEGHGLVERSNRTLRWAVDRPAARGESGGVQPLDSRCGERREQHRVDRRLQCRAAIHG